MLNLSSIPTKPGIYQFFDKNKELLYVGKAKNLKNRIRSYFSPSADLSSSKKIMVNNIKNIKYTIVNNETEALLLEKNLIHKNQPPFNIELKDDKNFTYIKIDFNQSYPQIQITRTFQPGNKLKYFGPYTSALTTKRITGLIRKIIANQIGWDDYWQHQKDLSQANIKQTDYLKIISQIIQLLNGNDHEIIDSLNIKMETASQNKNYELATTYRDYIKAIKNTNIKQSIIFKQQVNEDYLSLYKKENNSVISLFKVRGGKIINQDNFNINHKKNLNSLDILTDFCEQYYSQTLDWPNKIISNEKINFSIENIIPQKGAKLKLLKLGLINAKDFANKQTPSWQKDKITKALNQLQKGLKLKHQLNRIEIYDISNIQGVFAVGSMVVFTNGLPNKKQYRKFKIKNVVGPDDHHMMAEVIARRLNHSDWPTPDLIILDCGKPQLSTVLKNNNIAKDKIIALAKKEELVYTAKQEMIKFKPNTGAYFLLQRMRDEAHRFAINFYRHQHQKTSLTSQLDSLPNIGPKTINKLKKKYQTWDKIKLANQKELISLIGKNKANIIKNS